MDANGWFPRAGGGQYDFFKVMSGFFFDVFDGDGVSPGRFFLERKGYVRVVFQRLCAGYFKWVFFIGENGDALDYFFPGLSFEIDHGRFHIHYFFNGSRYSQPKLWTVRIVCDQSDAFSKNVSPIPIRVDLNCDFSLAAGRDLFGVKNSGAPSGRDHPFDFQILISPVVDGKIMLDQCAVMNRREFITGFWGKNGWGVFICRRVGDGGRCVSGCFFQAACLRERDVQRNAGHQAQQKRPQARGAHFYTRCSHWIHLDLSGYFI